MTENRAYELGRDAGLSFPFPDIPKGISVALEVAQAPLPPEILPGTAQARAFKLGYHDGLRGRRTIVRGQ